MKIIELLKIINIFGQVYSTNKIFGPLRRNIWPGNDEKAPARQGKTGVWEKQSYVRDWGDSDNFCIVN